jgi:hypothetical protein
MGCKSTLLRVGVGLFALTLGACGGGGGDSSAPAPQTSGLVPAAPALGATLVSDATALRPLIPNGVWTYQGTESGAGAPSVTYTNTVTHQAAAGGAVSESGTNQANLGSYTQSVSHRSGEVHISSTLDLGNGQSETADQLELRSPVRVNDQVTILDAGGLDLGSDLDGDGRNELLDIASYSRVIGQETIDLVNNPGISAVRVTTFVVARVRATRGQSGTDTSTVDTWYAQGIGIVRINTDLPTTTGARRLTSETLVSPLP